MEGRPSHPVALAPGLPKTQTGQRWSSLRGALLLVDLMQEGAPWLELATYKTTGIHSMFELMVRAH